MLDMPALAQGDAVPMQHTRLQNTFTCQPQQRNMHGRVFGGFLMRWCPGTATPQHTWKRHQACEAMSGMSPVPACNELPVHDMG